MTKGDAPLVDEKIKIICRIRPFLDHEAKEPAIQVKNGTTIALDNKRDPANPHLYKNFSSCYSSTASQDSIFAKDVRPLIERVFEGFDATVFAYGVTGSGKTFTMQGNKEEPGIIPRVAEFLFETKHATQISTIDITMSYMEILKETVFDMLTTKGKNKALDIREDINRDVFVPNLTEKPIKSYAEFQKFFSAASKNRSTASTKLNTRSSRSHAILTFKVTTVTPTKDEQHDETVLGKINLIDLAGSEDNRKSGNGKARMTESAAINKSLFVLGQVVEALNNGSSRVPYRNSKMTRILQSTLSGNSLGMMIINIAPGHNFLNDTTNTLNFAHRSKEIKSTPKANIRRTKAIPRNKPTNDISPQQQSTTTVTANTNTYTPRISLDQESLLHRSTHRSTTTTTTTTTKNHNVNRQPIFKRPWHTYEQQMRKRSRHSLSPNDAAKYTNSSISPPGAGYRSSSSSLSPTSIPIRQQQRAWSTITVSNPNHQHDHIPSVNNLVTTMPVYKPRSTDYEKEDMVTMTRADYNNLWSKLTEQAKQELMSSMNVLGL
ncbi:P-loop containing nucleoside triphosphate hydrolase protein [Chlamydoabsidia padenii]|nr:P-loop containing nucleoside triphosphate hydrolase protein [Chlamydoabsidia padenii]